MFEFLLSSVCFRGAEVVVLLMPGPYIKHHSNKLICLREKHGLSFPTGSWRLSSWHTVARVFL